MADEKNKYVVPEHKWDGTSLSFEDPSNEWGESIDLKGEKGDKGNDGYSPVKGTDYNDGIDGNDGKDGEPGTMGPIGPQGLKGDKGDKGDTGATGATGPKGDNGQQGPPGQNGKDAPINQPPTIELKYLSGTHKKCDGYTFNITIHITDADDSSVHTTISYAESCDPHLGYSTWIKVSEFVGNNVNGIGSVSLKSATSVFWLVESWDGSDITDQVYEYTIN
jgi:hypothetical protein